MPLSEDQKRVLLLQNLMSRMEYNEPQGVWKLTGAITRGEREALVYALDLLVIESDKCNR